MATNYSLKCKNDSTISGKFCVYQTMPRQSRDILSLAWFAKPCNKGTFVNFTWAIDYCATWSTVGELVPGVVYEAGQTISVDPSNTAKNSTGFTIENEGYIFEESTKKANKGDIGIYCSDIIPNREASIGVGMGSKTAFATSALTSMNFIFTPDIKYWIIFGKFEEGEVMNMTQTTDAVEIVYDPNVYTLSATLGKDNKIKIGR